MLFLLILQKFAPRFLLNTFMTLRNGIFHYFNGTQDGVILAKTVLQKIVELVQAASLGCCCIEKASTCFVATPRPILQSILHKAKCNYVAKEVIDFTKYSTLQRDTKIVYVNSFTALHARTCLK